MPFMQKESHLSAECFTHSRTASTHEVSSMDSAYLGTLSGKLESGWTTVLKVEDIDMQLKLDIGAEVTAI